MLALVVLLVTLASVLVLAGPAGATRSHPPTKLWSEYPLVAQTTATAAAGSGAVAPVAPPPAAAVEAAPADRAPRAGLSGRRCRR